jgi:hypothetical protein
MAETFRTQGRACARLGSPMYADLLGRMADDIAAGGVSRDLLAGHEQDPGPSALALRLAGSVHRLILERRAGAVAPFYPSVGGVWEPVAGWAAFEDLLRDQADAVLEWLDRAPQTNEIGRAGALMGGLLQLDPNQPRRVRLFEIGSSGGLNLRADRFGYTDQHGRRFGDPDAGLLLEGAWRGRRLDVRPGLEIVQRLGSDVLPIDVTSSLGRLTLTSYVWPDQTARLDRLRAAFEVAREVPAEVRRQDAVSFVNDLELMDQTSTVLWHSVMWQYLNKSDQDAVSARIEELGAQATRDRPFAHLYLEPTRRTPGGDHQFLVSLRTWPGGVRRVLGRSVGHGIPTTWE